MSLFFPVPYIWKTNYNTTAIETEIRDHYEFIIGKSPRDEWGKVPDDTIRAGLYFTWSQETNQNIDKENNPENGEKSPGILGTMFQVGNTTSKKRKSFCNHSRFGVRKNIYDRSPSPNREHWANKWYSRSTLYGTQNIQQATYQGQQPTGFNFAANTRQAEGNFQG